MYEVVVRAFHATLEHLGRADGGELAEGRVEAGIEERGLHRVARRGNRLLG